MMRNVVMLLACLAVAACGDSAPAANAPAKPAVTAVPKLNAIDRSHAGTAAPNLVFEWHGGERVRMADFQGQKVLVNLWATWCAPCVAEMPQLDRLAGARRGKLLVLPVSQDMEGWLAVNKFFTPGKFNTIQPYVDQPGSFAEAIKANGLPISILYDEKGREIWRVAGTPDWNALAAKGVV
jgi:thiol-disulfide isomerase/thioredoxin